MSADLKRAAWAAFAAHLVAGLAMALVLRRGLETEPDVAARIAFIAEHRTAWTLGWLSWTLAGWSILCVFDRYAAAHGLPKAAVGVTILAVALDMSAQAIEVLVLPELGVAEPFLKWHRRSVLLTGFAANGLYTAATAMLVWPTRGRYEGWVDAAAAGIVAGGVGLSAAALAGSTLGMVLSNVLLVPALLAWLVGVSGFSTRKMPGLQSTLA